MTQLFIGVIAEGNTDYRFLIPIIEKVLVKMAFQCRGQIDIDVIEIECSKGSSFSDYVTNAAEIGLEKYGITMLVVHADADNLSSKHTYTTKINPAIDILNKKPNNTHCKNIIALVPIQEMESWMLADKEIFIKSINTKKTEIELNVFGNPESFNNPKERILEAIKIARLDMPKKLRNKLNISDLYSYLGESISVEKLSDFNSYRDFEENIKKVFVNLNLISP